MLHNHSANLRHAGEDSFQISKSGQENPSFLNTDVTAWPVLVCLLGPFRLLAAGRPVPIRGESKAAMLLAALALRNGHPIARETLLNLFWPASEVDLAGDALRSLVRDLHKRLHVALGGTTPALHTDGYYRLNIGAGIGVDVACFDALADAGARENREGNPAAAAEFYEHALGLYRGDLCVALDEDEQATVERERLRGRYLTLLAALADYHYSTGDYAASLTYAHRLLAHDTCREDAHRLAMRCYVRQGERAQALRQYQLCVRVLHNACDAAPEPATTVLFDQVRQHPSSI